MYLLGGLFSDSNEGLDPALAPQGDGKVLVPP